MDTNIIVALISTGGAVFVSIVALVLNSKRFDDMGKRFDDMGKRFDEMGKRMDKMENRLAFIQTNLEEFYRDITRLKERAGL